MVCSDAFFCRLIYLSVLLYVGLNGDCAFGGQAITSAP
jgi:hypothetical protein